MNPVVLNSIGEISMNSVLKIDIVGCERKPEEKQDICIVPKDLLQDIY